MSGNRSKSAFFEGVGHFERRFQREGGIAHQPLLVSENYRVIAVSRGIKIFTVRRLVFSQYTHLTDGQTDRQNCDSNTVRCITCSRTVKIGDQKILKPKSLYMILNQNQNCDCDLKLR